MRKHDVIIIGGGPGGSTLAALLAKQGFDVGIFEREIYPRFHIGESLLPSTMPIFKETGFYETLDSGKYIRKFGARFIDYRDDDAEIYFGFEEGLNRAIPMAFEVPRSEFDKDILEHARKCGATVYQPEKVKTVTIGDTKVNVTTNKGEYEALYIADASGRDSILGKQFNLRKKNNDLNNVAVFSHFNGVGRLAGKSEGDIVIGLLPEQSWSWVIPFQGDCTSVGVVCHSNQYKGTHDLHKYLIDSVTSSTRLRYYMKNAERTGEVTVISNYSHHCESYAGDRWILIGDSAVFLDPIFSSGVHVSCTSAKLASGHLTKCLRENITLTTNGKHERYKAELDKGVQRFHALISLFYNSNFVENMRKTLTRENFRQGFTSAVAGDMWNDDNFIFKMKVL
jgi:flavin-dependent dehydrogenase